MSRSRQNDFELVVALETSTGKAAGPLYLDDGESIDSVANKEFLSVNFTAIFDSRQGVGKLVSYVDTNGWKDAGSLVIYLIFKIF